MSVFKYFDEVYQIEPRQRLMLESLILTAPEHERSFSRWLAEIDFNTFDNLALRLVPALFRKFGDAKGDNPHRARMKGIYPQRLVMTPLAWISTDGRSPKAAATRG